MSDGEKKLIEDKVERLLNELGATSFFVALSFGTREGDRSRYYVGAGEAPEMMHMAQSVVYEISKQDSRFEIRN